MQNIEFLSSMLSNILIWSILFALLSFAFFQNHLIQESCFIVGRFIFEKTNRRIIMTKIDERVKK